MKKILLIIIFLFFSGLLFVMLRNEKEVNDDLQIKRNSFIEGLKVLQKKEGITIWTLIARRADFIEDETKAKLSDITVVVKENGLVFHADKALYNLSNRNFTTEGEIKAEAKDYTITADSIDYEASSGDIKTAGRIRVDGKGFRVEGKGMESDSEQKVRILKDVRATFFK
ncbi:MAG: LPS export ABC transporter periplasmic protein LptC [Nitrospirota bacterium]